MSVTAAPGFVAAGIASGIKPGEASDLALVATEPSAAVAAAAVFTTNKAAAAPVVVSRQHLAATQGRVGAVVLNSGCANAATGAGGIAAARCAAWLAGLGLGLPAESVLVCSTGVIGSELPVAALETGIPALVASRSGGPDAGRRAAVAIMTTDTRPKETVCHGHGYVVGGMGKGAGMLAPDMATMLAVLTTDAEIDPPALDAALRRAVDASFNALSIDGCTSTNDTVVVMASGSGERADPAEFAKVLTQACQDLALQMARDAEGATKLVRVQVSGAPDAGAARRVARAIADSSLVKCSWYGADPNWGRVVSEAGASGVPFDLDSVAVSYGEVTVCAGGRAVPHDADAVRRHLAGTDILVRCDLGLGDAESEILSADLTHGYVDENMGLS